MTGDGLGPNSQSARKTAVEQCRTLDINDLDREGLLAPGTGGTTTWSHNQKTITSIDFRRTSTPSDEAALRLSYTITDRGGEQRPIDYLVPLTFTECNFGGTRPWFVCPGAECGERVGKLYRPPAANRFLCRHCHDLGYQSSQKSGTAFYENVTKPLQTLEAARVALRDEGLDRERLRAYYEARKVLDEGIAREFDTNESVHYLSVPSTFEEWRDRLLKRSGITQGYGAYGRCEATAKTTGERCRQSAIGHHGKCHYHGGAPDSGIGKGQRDHAEERVNARADESQKERRSGIDRIAYPLAATGGSRADQA